MRAVLSVVVDIDDGASLDALERVASHLEIEASRHREVRSVHAKRLRIERPRKGDGR